MGDRYYRINLRFGFEHVATEMIYCIIDWTDTKMVNVEVGKHVG
jgi:hypothetical protein